MKSLLKKGVAFALTLLLLLSSICFADEPYVYSAEETKKLVIGGWLLKDENENCKRVYEFSSGGIIREETTLYDTDGTPITMSMSDMITMTFEVCGKDEILLFGEMYGQRVALGSFEYRFEDQDTLWLEDSMYERIW